MEEYRRALNEMSSFDFGSIGWKAAREKAKAIARREIQKRNVNMAFEIFDEIEGLAECGFKADSDEIAWGIALLEDNGFEDLAEGARELLEA